MRLSEHTENIKKYLRGERNLQVLFFFLAVIITLISLFYLRLDFKQMFFYATILPLILISLFSPFFATYNVIVFHFNRYIINSILKIPTIQIPAFSLTFAKFLGVLMVVSFIFNYILKGKKVSLTSPFTRYSFVFLVLVQIISALFSYRVLPSLGAVLTLIMLIIFYFIIINIFKKLFALKILTYTFIILNIVNSIIMLYNSQSQKFRITAIFINPSELAFFLNISLIFIIMYFLRTEKILYKLFFGFLIFLNVSTCILTQARGGFVGLGIIFFLYSIFSRNKSLIVATIIISIIVVITLVPDVYLTRIKDFQEKLIRKFQSGEEIHEIRLEITRIALNVFKKHPVFGVGPGNFLPYVREIHPEAWDIEMYQQRLAIHSTYLNALTESGIVGLFFLILMLFSILLDFIKSLKLTYKHSDEELKGYTIAFFILYILFLAYGIFSASLINRTTVFIMASGFILYELNLEAINKLNKKPSKN